ncbi:hypothetical protein TNCV_1115631 [Trichonephila clavipes]|nr:hypothetical protein TNCV_1115631 [Trichonephila clavipes]
MPRKRVAKIYPANSPLRMLPITRNQSAFIRNYEIWRNDLEEKDFLETCKSLSIVVDNPFIITRSRFSLLNMDDESLYAHEELPDYNTRNDPMEIKDYLLEEISRSPRLKGNWVETESSFPDAEKEMRIQKERHSEFPSETFEIPVPFKNRSAAFVPNLLLTSDIQIRQEKKISQTLPQTPKPVALRFHYLLRTIQLHDGFGDGPRNFELWSSDEDDLSMGN